MSLVLSFVLSLSKGPVEGLHYWYMLPLAIVIATIVTASGVGGATFFAPYHKPDQKGGERYGRD